MKTKEREDGIVAAYRAGDKITEIEERFEVGRSTIYHILRRTGTLPSRTTRTINAQARDETLAGLYELIRFQDRRIEELEERNVVLEKAAARSSKATTARQGSRKAAGA